jgi:acetylornithine deacetylase
MGRNDVPSEITHEHRVTAYLERLIQSLGVPYNRQTVAPGRDNLIAEYHPPTPSVDTMIWECHQDTVPVDGMIVDPFGASIEGGKLYGRGACDVKAGAAAMLSAFARLVREKPPGSAQVTLAFVVDEEHTFLGIQHLMRSGLTAQAAIVAEPTSLDIVTAHKGVVRWRIETTGRACHSSQPDQGINAIYRMGRVLRGIETYAEQLGSGRSDPDLGYPSLSVGMIHGGASPNTIPDHCRIEIDRRLIPGENPNTVSEELNNYLRNSAGIDFEFVSTPPVFACPALTPRNIEGLQNRLGQAINSVRGCHRVLSVPYGTDASTIAESGIPTVVFGPGHIEQAHTKDEWVELSQVEAAAEILFRCACATDHENPLQGRSGRDKA